MARIIKYFIFIVVLLANTTVLAQKSEPKKS